MQKRKLTKTGKVKKRQKTSKVPLDEAIDNEVDDSDNDFVPSISSEVSVDAVSGNTNSDGDNDDEIDDDEIDAKPDVPVTPTIDEVGKKQFYNKPPTNEELNRLRETQNLFHSTLFRLQISEILHEVKVKAKRFKVIDKAVEIVKNIVLSIEPMERYDLQDHSWLKGSKIKVPVSEEPKSLKGVFKFVPPEVVQVAGSYAHGTCVRQNMAVDIVLKMPGKFFKPKDHLNHRYIRKRALYLCKVASVLNTNPLIEDVEFTYLNGNHFKPVLVCNVKVEDTKTVKVQIHAIPEADVFTLNKFHVSKNNVRSGWFQGDEAAEIPPENDVPTPFYNCTMLEDILATDEKLTDRIEACSSGVKEGIILLKIWLRQRELDRGFGGFSGHIMMMYVLYLLSKRKLNQQMSSYQIMRNTLLKLQDADWTTNGISLCFKTDDSTMPLLSEFHKHFGVVFVDPSGFLNLCYAMNTSTFERVKHEASIAMQSLEDKSIDSFDRLFMKQVPFSNKFDHIFHIYEKSSFESCVDKFGLRPAQYLDYGRKAVYTCLPSMLQVLRDGLGRRVTLIQSQLKEPKTWKVTKKPPDHEDKLTFGLMLDSDHAFNVLDRGPSADKPEAMEFRKFWGEKSDLRRFQDGGICEAVLWVDSKKVTHKQMVCRQIVKFILQRHCGITSSLETPTVQYIGDQLNSVLSSVATSDENALTVMNVYNDLCKILRKLDDLPLTVLSVQGVSPCFRNTEVFPPALCTFKHKEKKVITKHVQRYVPESNSNCPVFIPTLKVVCTMETSGKWPDNVEAMQRLKAAFLIQMADMIKSQYNLPVKVSTAHIDVLKDNYVFRLVPAYTKEIDLLRTVKTDDGLVRKRDTAEALALEKDIISLPKLTSTIHGIQQTHPSFSTTVRLAKRWISSHMLGDFIQAEALELIVVYLYLSPAPYTPPKTGLVGFQRFLELLSTFDWKMNPLVVNLNKEFTEEDLQEISTQFSQKRNQLPLMFISTPQNRLTSHWTVSGPTAPILHRLVLLAQKSLEVIQNQISTERSIDMKQVFRVPLELYDVLFELNIDMVAQSYHQVDVTNHIKQGPMQATSNTKTQDCFPVTNFSPVKLLLKEIRESFDDVCIVFHDQFGGSVIGLVWKPEAFQTKEFKISTVRHTMLKMEDGSKPALVQNIDAIIEDILIMGRGLVTKVTTKNSD